MSGKSPAVAGAEAKGDFVSRFGHIVGAAWLGGAVLYAASCMQFAY
jgi:hypothetical protein